MNRQTGPGKRRNGRPAGSSIAQPSSTGIPGLAGPLATTAQPGNRS